MASLVHSVAQVADRVGLVVYVHSCSTRENVSFFMIRSYPVTVVAQCSAEVLRVRSQGDLPADESKKDWNDAYKAVITPLTPTES